MEKLEIQIGLDVIRSYRRLSYDPWYALAEFVDNSTQSYSNNKRALDAAYAQERARLRVSFEYDRYAGDGGILIVRDNAMGMSQDELKRALHIGKPPNDTTGRSQYGLGLKTAACWFGNLWTVRTKKLGEEVGYQVTVDVEEVASGNSHVLPTETFISSKKDHYTEIRIERLNLTLQGRRLGKTKESLASMYRVDIRGKKLEIYWDTTRLDWSSAQELLAYEGRKRRKVFRFSAGENRTVKGWVGVLAPGSSSRSNAGFALIRRGRLIREAWRPEAIFGPPPGRNDLINQRVTGEIHLDEFDVSHTKDDILWQKNEEDEVQEGIKERAEDVLRFARDYRHAQPVALPLAVVDKGLAIDAALKDSAFGLDIARAGATLSALADELGPPEVMDLAADSFVRAMATGASLMRIQIEQGKAIDLFASKVLAKESPFMSIGPVTENTWALVLNSAHSVYTSSEDTEALRANLQHAVADGLVMWTVAEGRVSASPASIVALKDALLRLIVQG